MLVTLPYLITFHITIWLVSEGKNLPHCYPKTPHITFGGEALFKQALQGIPGIDAKQSNHNFCKIAEILSMNWLVADRCVIWEYMYTRLGRFRFECILENHSYKFLLRWGGVRGLGESSKVMRHGGQCEFYCSKKLELRWGYENTEKVLHSWSTNFHMLNIWIRSMAKRYECKTDVFVRRMEIALRWNWNRMKFVNKTKQRKDS